MIVFRRDFRARLPGFPLDRLEISPNSNGLQRGGWNCLRQTKNGLLEIAKPASVYVVQVGPDRRGRFKEGGQKSPAHKCAAEAGLRKQFMMVQFSGVVFTLSPLMQSSSPGSGGPYGPVDCPAEAARVSFLARRIPTAPTPIPSRHWTALDRSTDFQRLGRALRSGALNADGVPERPASSMRIAVAQLGPIA